MSTPIDDAQLHSVTSVISNAVADLQSASDAKSVHVPHLFAPVASTQHHHHQHLTASSTDASPSSDIVL